MIAIYARQSIDKKDSISIDTQVDFCKRTISEGESYKIYSDKGYSGSNTNRPGFETMLNDLKNGLITKLIVYKLDRISRSILDFADIVQILEKAKVKFASATETFDTSTPIGRAMLHIIMVFAQLERETIQNRITDNYYERAKKGFFMGGTPPYGFTRSSISLDGRNTSMYLPDPETMPNLIEMFNMYYTSNSLGSISEYLNRNNIKAAKGGNWASSKISKLLSNPAYVKADADVYAYYKSKGVTITNDVYEFIGTNGCFLYGKKKQ